ncbi:hypothetical protein J132_08792 [Termitomyces sp. J132]|nr:hypothetical protein J132_08792 [Termitomyces sp. J132]
MSALWYHLGSASKHTVYKAEAVELTLGLHLLMTCTCQLRHMTIIGTDSQAAICALNNQQPHSAHYILDHIHTATKEWRPRIWKVIKLQVHWLPGHINFALNKQADALAKEVAQELFSLPSDLPLYLKKGPLPHSIPEICHIDLTATRVLWKRHWKKSLHFSAIHALNKMLPSKNFLRLVKHLDQRHSALITQLHMSHLPLNQHLFCTCKAESLTCPHCLSLTIEMVKYYLFEYPQYWYKRHVHFLWLLKCRAESLSFILNDPSALTHLIRYIDTTKHFQDTHQPAPAQPHLQWLTSPQLTCAHQTS